MWKTLLDVVQPIMEEARFLPCEDEVSIEVGVELEVVGALLEPVAEGHTERETVARQTVSSVRTEGIM